VNDASCASTRNWLPVHRMDSMKVSPVLLVTALIDQVTGEDGGQAAVYRDLPLVDHGADRGGGVRGGHAGRQPQPGGAEARPARRAWLARPG